MIHEYDLAAIVRVYQGSDGAATKAMYMRLDGIGPMGQVATNVFRATKCSERAKVYRGGGHKGQAYQTKTWAMTNLCTLLQHHAEQLGIRWGWGEDPKQTYHRFVLYVEIPTGQVSFHTDVRGEGPDYPGQWDGKTGQGTDRICRWAARLLKVETAAEAA